MTTYSVRFRNKSKNAGTALIYQKGVDINAPDAQSLAWFSKGTNSGTNVTFRWTIDYSFVWSEIGELTPGVVFNANQVVDTDLKKKNAITLTRNESGYVFKDQSDSAPGVLHIYQDETIPYHGASVGIGMSGNGTFAVPSHPKLTALFTPHPKYYMAFSLQHIQEGQILDIDQFTNAVEIPFPPSCYSVFVELDETNNWHVTPLPNVNAFPIEG
ncbi:hypothetical protein [Brevibacillus brevis]|uniref:hypothetical protein n=1 Tax=Brevibacillus brevis TaxID=1393 RepID=UPI0037C776FE